jgi:Spy/CpxP family protein refolding chaperone
MNKIKLTVLSFGIILGSTVFAQDQKQAISKEQRQEMHMDKLATELTLTDVQKEQITVLRKNSMEARKKVKNDASLDEAGKKSAMKALQQQNKAKMAEILTEEQALKLKEIRQEKKEHKKGEGKKKGAKKDAKIKEQKVKTTPVE